MKEIMEGRNINLFILLFVLVYALHGLKHAIKKHTQNASNWVEIKNNKQKNCINKYIRKTLNSNLLNST